MAGREMTDTVWRTGREVFFSHNERRKMYFERGKKFLLSTFMGRENSQNYRLRTGTREGKEEWEEREGKRRGGW
jgi:hypothetical protein